MAEDQSTVDKIAAKFDEFSTNVANFFGLEKLDQEDVNALQKASDYAIIRKPWRMYLRSWTTGGNEEGGKAKPKKNQFLSWSVNPSEVTWDMPLRASHQKNLYGTVMHVWFDPGRGTFYDEFRLNIKFNSGSIMPTWIGDLTPKKIKPSDDLVNPQKKINVKFKKSKFVDVNNVSNFIDQNTDDLQGVINDTATSNAAQSGYESGFVYTEEFKESHGIVNFYDFLNLVDAPKLTDQGEVNWVIIEYHSNIFPNLILRGMFDASGVKFTDSSNSPAEIENWSADFIVYDSQPKLSVSAVQSLKKENTDLMNAYRDAKIGKKITLGQIGDKLSGYGDKISDFFK